jgi:thiol-disulfide isomerase/thioredoxin
MIRLLSIPIFFLFLTNLYSQTSLPDIQAAGTDGKQYRLSDFGGNNQPAAVIFWATWCKPCIDELDNLSELLAEKDDPSSYNIITICIDDARTASTTRSFVAGKQWPFLVLIDINQDIKRAMNVTDIPHYILFDKNGKHIRKHTGYLPGDEDILLDEIISLMYEK